MITFMKREKSLVVHFKSKAREIINENDIETVKLDASSELLNRISDWITEGSGWVIKSVDKHEIDTYLFTYLFTSPNTSRWGGLNIYHYQKK